jgi:hypothetical protein
MIPALRTLAVLALVMLASGTASADSGRASDRVGQGAEPSLAAREAQRRERVARRMKDWTAEQLAAEIKRLMDEMERDAKSRDTKRPR